MNEKIVFSSQSAEETRGFAARLARRLKAGDILCLFGDLGSGKTTFVKGLASGLRIKPESVTSPTFVLLQVYEGRLPVYHFDFYRMEKPAEIVRMGFEEFMYGQGIAVIEWPERLGPYVPSEAFNVTLHHGGATRRKVVVTAQSDGLQRRLSGWLSRGKGRQKDNSRNRERDH